MTALCPAQMFEPRPDPHLRHLLRRKILEKDQFPPESQESASKLQAVPGFSVFSYYAYGFRMI